jgi:dienelactone hydrolase
MPDTVLDKPDPQAFANFIQAQAKALRAGDQAPATRKEWDGRRAKLREAMFAAMGPFPDKPCPLEPREVGVLKRTGYRIEKLLFQSRPDVWVTASAYVPEPVKGKLPAVLAVHGHWPWARRDPVVQARCLGLVQLGFFVLVVDAFGAGERHPAPAKGCYHGALLGSALWPAGQTLLGMQVYDNRRAVDYLRSRPEVDGDRLGITGASGGGNQTMYAGALDERFRAVVPVCSVGNFQAYLQAAACVCEILPGVLRFTEEGDVLGLVAPRALMVVNATKDAFQFSVAEATKSLERTRAIFKLHDAEEKLRHAVFESPHDYNRAMREAMYGWMTRWLKDEGKGEPIPEPKHDVETPEALSCFPDGKRPATFLFPPTFAAREAKALLAPFADKKRDHKEAWEAAAVVMRTQLRSEIFGGFPKPPESIVKPGKGEDTDGIRTIPVLLHPEPDLPLPMLLKFKSEVKGRKPACVLLDLDGKAEALKHPLAAALVNKGWLVAAPDLRATGETKPAGGAVAGASDHNSSEHAILIGRPLLGQWVFDVLCLFDWLEKQERINRDHLTVVGIGPAGVVALCAAGLLEDRVASVAALDAPVSVVTEEAYGLGWRMGLLAPGLLRVGDVPHLAALAAPRRLAIAGGVTPRGQKLAEKPLQDAFGFTARVYHLHKEEKRFRLAERAPAADLAAFLAGGTD